MEALSRQRMLRFSDFFRRHTPWKMNGWNLQITHFYRKWSEPNLHDSGSMLIFRGVPQKFDNLIYRFLKVKWMNQICWANSPLWIILGSYTLYTLSSFVRVWNNYRLCRLFPPIESGKYKHIRWNTVDGSEIRLAAWEVKNLVNNGTNYQPQLVSRNP